MKQTIIQKKKIKGKRIRTNNTKVEEIINLWAQVPEMDLKGSVYAVYFNYESDHHGDYDLLIGNDSYQSIEEVVIESGNYVKVEILEATPEKVGMAWQKIWADEDLYEKRLFTTDFECYSTDGKAEIYLAVK